MHLLQYVQRLHRSLHSRLNVVKWHMDFSTAVEQGGGVIMLSLLDEFLCLYRVGEFWPLLTSCSPSLNRMLPKSKARGKSPSNSWPDVRQSTNPNTLFICTAVLQETHVYTTRQIHCTKNIYTVAMAFTLRLISGKWGCFGIKAYKHRRNTTEILTEPFNLFITKQQILVVKSCDCELWPPWVGLVCRQ